MTQIQVAQAALSAHQENAQALGPCLRAVRALCAVGRVEQARALAWDFVRRENLDQRRGDALVAFAQQAPVKRFAPGQSIIKEGQTDDAVYLLIDGEARVRRLGAGEVGTVHSGDFVGEFATVAGTARTASVYARGHVEALALPPAALAELARFVPGIYPKLLQTTRARLIQQVMGPRSLFAELDGRVRKMLFTHFFPGTVLEGTTLIEEGKPSSSFRIIVSGLVEVWKTGPSGERQTIASLGPGKIFGEASILFDQPAVASVEAVSPVTYVALDRARFRQIVGQNVALRDRLIVMSCKRLGIKKPPKEEYEGLEIDLDDSLPEITLTTGVFNAETCRSCGFPDAGPVCIACGSIA